jgi:hypothetical protein
MNMQRYIVMRVLLAIFLLFVVVFAIVKLAGNNSTPDTPEFAQEETQTAQTDISVQPSSVEFRIIGKTIAEEDHREIRFIIREDRRVVQIIQGYNGKVVKTLSLPNSDNSYQQFVYAIQDEGFSTDKATITISDPNGVCSDGRQYHYTLKREGVTEKSLWSTSCKSADGTFGGSRRAIQRLFERQFPSYDDFTDEVDI